MSKKKRTGLGRDALFQSPKTQPEQEDAAAEQSAQTGEAVQQSTEDESQPSAEEATAKREKVRTTVRIYATTYGMMEALKVYERRQGNKATYSDILEEAIIDLAKKKGLDPKEALAGLGG